MSESQTDVVVIGGGPAGSTVSTLVAQKGYKVELFERDSFPRFHIGESMIPYSFNVMERLNFLDKMRASHFTKKYSVQFVNEHGKLSEPFFFDKHEEHARSQTWQVRRSEFDLMLLNNAREHGVKVQEQTRVLEVLFEGDRATGVRIKQGEEERVVRAKVVVDASGQSSMLIDRMNLREWDPVLRKGAVWTYWKDAHRAEGNEGGSTIVISTKGKKGWFWYIPLHDNITSVGVVANFDYLFKDRDTKDLEAIYFEEVDRCPGVKERIANATRCDQFRAQREYSYCAKKVAGNGWVLVGDAFGFLDPLYSSGVLLALTSGARAADAIGDALAANDTSEARLRTWEEEFRTGLERMRRLIYAFYDGLSFGQLVRRNPHKKGLITDVLIGNLFKEEVDELWPLIEELNAYNAKMAAEGAPGSDM